MDSESKIIQAVLCLFSSVGFVLDLTSLYVSTLRYRIDWFEPGLLQLGKFALCVQELDYQRLHVISHGTINTTLIIL